jgi:hypothetical protein
MTVHTQYGTDVSENRPCRRLVAALLKRTLTPCMTPATRSVSRSSSTVGIFTTQYTLYHTVPLFTTQYHSLLRSTLLTIQYTLYYGMYRLTSIMSPEIGVRRSKDCECCVVKSGVSLLLDGCVCMCVCVCVHIDGHVSVCVCMYTNSLWWLYPQQKITRHSE